MKKIKLLALFLLLLQCCIAIMGTGCKKNEDNGILTEIEFFKFSDFECEADDQWNIKNGYINNGNYVITSQEEFNEILNIECSPQIDFSNYIVLAGSTVFSNGIYIHEEKVEENNSEVKYTVTFTSLITDFAQPIKYYVIIDRPSVEKEINFVKDYTN